MGGLTPRATIDFETRSECSIRNSGSWRYTLDPTTEVLCLAYRLPHWEAGRTGLWHPALLDLDECELGGDSAFEDLGELFTWVDDNGLVEAHNAFFERGIWKHKMLKAGWPAIRSHQWRCSAAKAAALALPRGLEDVGEVLSLPVRKDMEGSAVMKKMTKPRKALKSEWDAWGQQHAPCALCGAKGKVDGINPETGRKKKMPCMSCSGRGWLGTREALPEMPTLWHETRELFERLFTYCRVDVLAEEALSERIPDLSEEETRMYLLDQEINEHGFALDTDAVDVALELIEGEQVGLNAELAELTAGAVTKASQRAKMLRWFAENGLELDDTKADTIEGLLESRDVRKDITAPVWRALEIMQALGKSSTAKYETMKDWVCPDGRVHGGLLYHGASTGRWTGSGVQPHNFVRGDFDPAKPYQKDPDFIWAVLESKDREFIEYEYGTVMAGLSNGLRGAIVAGDGSQLYVADFNAIETRGLFWIAGETKGLEVFRDPTRDIYNEFASKVFGYPVFRKRPEHDFQGKLGKEGILGLGYQMGASKFVDRAAAYGITLQEDFSCSHVDLEVSPFPCSVLQYKHRDEDHDFVYDGDPNEITSAKVVQTYRSTYTRVVQFWKDIEAAAIRAVRFDHPVRCGKLTWFVEGDFLYCELPSGRRLAYYEPVIQQKPVPWGGTAPSLTFMGLETRFGPRVWKRLSAYGGLLTENVVQAICRDLMAYALLRLYETGRYFPVLSVHDEGIAEAKAGTGDVKEFEALMAACPDWAPGFPIKAEGWTGRRYRK